MTTTLNPSDKAGEITLSGGNLTATLTTDSSTRAAVRATDAITSGKKHIEVTIDVLGGNMTVGLMSSGDSLSQDPGRGAFGIGFNNVGFISIVRIATVVVGTNLGAPEGSIIGIDVDEPNGLCWFSVDGVFPEGDDPTTVAGGYDIAGFFSLVDCYPALGCDTDNIGTVLTVNFGATPFAFPTSGFSGLDEVITTWVPKVLWK